MPAKATAQAQANLAFIKYWGKADASINLPLNASISMNLSGATTVTTVEFDEQLTADQVLLRGAAPLQAHPQLPLPFGDSFAEASISFAQRVSKHLDRMRALAGIRTRARVVTSNSFPAGAGIASSASGLAALTVAADAALGLHLDQRQLSIMARRGSGSACRSIPAGFVEWHAGTDTESSFATQIAPANHWPIVDLAVIVSHEPKKVPSSEGHQLALGSQFSQVRLDGLPERTASIRRAILDCDFETFGRETEAEALAMHAIAMTSAHVADGSWRSGVYYWLPDTIELLAAVQEWRAQGLGVYFTLDAGPTVHLLCLADHVSEVAAAVELLASEREGRTWEIMRNDPGDGAVVVEHVSM
jgi:diphosphomevalonate decarboxylase